LAKCGLRRKGLRAHSLVAYKSRASIAVVEIVAESDHATGAGI
jgi:hypothetical protein